MTIRETLAKMGPERVRQGMIAFEHRADDPKEMRNCNHGICCFLSHAMSGWIVEDRIALGMSQAAAFTTRPAIEMAFEGDTAAPCSRDELRQECIAFLAEHGTTPEAPVSWDTEVVESVR